LTRRWLRVVPPIEWLLSSRRPSPTHRFIPSVPGLERREAPQFLLALAMGTAGTALVASAAQRFVADTRVDYGDFRLERSEPGAFATGEPFAPLAYASGFSHAVVFIDGWQSQRLDTSEDLDSFSSRTDMGVARPESSKGVSAEAESLAADAAGSPGNFPVANAPGSEADPFSTVNLFPDGGSGGGGGDGGVARPESAKGVGSGVNPAVGTAHGSLATSATTTTAFGAGLPTPLPPALGAGLPTPPPARANIPAPVGPTGPAGPLDPVPEYDFGMSNPAGDIAATATGASGNAPSLFSPAGVRYSDGAVHVASTDLSSAGFGMNWGVTRSWTNLTSTATGFNGSGWLITQLPHLRQDAGGTLTEVANSFNVRYFDWNGSAYVARFWVQDTLAADTANHQYIQTDTNADLIYYNDFSSSVPANERGVFKSFVDANGNVASVTAWTSDGKVQEIQRSNGSLVESYLYSYLASGSNAGLMSSVVLRRSTNGGSTWSTVRQVQYTYYSGEAHGNTGDLKLAQVQDGSGNTLDTTYYRYYTTESGGYTHGLKYVFRPDSYARLTAALGTSIDSISDSSAAPYADDYFEYDTSQRCTKHTVAGDGTTLGSGANGLGTYTYSYSTSSNSLGFNSWATKTVETFDGNQNTVYTNGYGEVMLAVYHDATSGNNWDSFFEYDGSGRVILSAQPSAINGYNDTYSDLLHYVSGSGYQYLNNSSGLIALIDYGSSTTATSTAAGDVSGYFKDDKIEQGQTGTAILQTGQQYFSRSAQGATIYPLANASRYRNTDGTGAETTSLTYTWQPVEGYGSSGMASQIIVSKPVISSGQNGPGSADQPITVYDSYGRPIWTKDADGFLRYTAYDQVTGAVIETIDDVNTSITSDFSNLPTGWSTPAGGGLNLLTTITVDALGRDTKITDPNGNVTYYVYNDTNYEARVYRGWNSSTNTPTGPTEDYRYDRPGSYTETLTMSAAPHLTNNAPDGTEAISSIQTLAREYTNSVGQLVSSDAYFNLSGLTYSTATHIGTLNTNYYETTDDYDSRGRQARVLRPTGTIDRTVYDGLDRVVSTWVGTNDTPTSGLWSPTNNTGSANMVQITGNVYDAGGVGDSLLTQVTTYPGGSAANRVSNYYYDWRDRLVASKDGVQASEDTTTHRPILYYTFDNLGEVTQVQQFDGDGVTITTSGGVPQAPSASLLRAQTNTSYDDRGRAYQSQTYSVNSSTGALSTYTLTTNDYYNHRGALIGTSAPGGVVTKDVYDGAGRVTTEYSTDGAGGSGWANAGIVTSDNVLQQVELGYDSDGNVILTTIRQRNHDESALGSLGTPTTSPKSRVSYIADYFDAANRLTNEVNVGTNGGGAWTRPSTVPTGSDTVLLTTAAYTAAGFVDSVTDPRGIVAKNYYDTLGRTTKTVQNYTGNPETSSSDVATEYTYDGDSNLLTLQADLPSSAYQQTKYIYGVTTAGGSGVNSNDIVVSVQHPDKTSGNPSSSEQDSYTVNALGQVLTFTDRNGNVHTFSYDVLGRQTSDTITTLGSGVDGAVRRIDTAYDTQGNPYLVTSYSDTGGSTIVNQVQRAYNGLGQLTKEYQAHSGAVNTSTTPNVQYTYVEMAGGANNSRLTSIVYPNGKTLNYNYASGTDSSISRLSSLSDTSGTLESYSYLGLDTVVKRGHSQPGVDLTYIKQSGESNGDAGDQYTGLDRFGRVVDQRWIITANGTHTDRFKYGYDRDSNPLYRDNLVNSSFGELYHANGSSNGYDNLNQLVAFARGTLNGTHDTISSPAHSITWSLDALGNFNSTTTDGGSAVNNSFNKQNEETAAGSSTLAFDSNGNLTTDDQGHTLVYDAWNRLVAVKNGSTTLVSYKYDGLGRRMVENPGTARDLYYSANWQVLEERYNGGSTADIQYVWSPVYVDALVLRDRSTQHNGTLDERLWVQLDANWNVTALINGSGSVVERYVYDPYGKVTFLSASWSTLSASAYAWIYLHQGSRWDSTSGFYNRRGREYSPTLGRWLQVDPIGFAGGDANIYRFVGNSPTNLVDPSGLFSMGFADQAAALMQQAAAAGMQDAYNQSSAAAGHWVMEYQQQMMAQSRQQAANRPPPRSPTYQEEFFKAVGQGSEASYEHADMQLDKTLNARMRASAEGRPVAPLTAGDVQLYGSDGNQTAGAAMAQAGQQIREMMRMPLEVLSYVPGLGTIPLAILVADDLMMGNYGSAALRSLGFLGASDCLFNVICFAAGTPLLTPTGDKPIEQFKPGDWILTAPDTDPSAPLEAKQVEEVFTNHCPLLNLHVQDRVIQTTPEHPFWVRGQGWTAAKDLKIGDLLRSHDGQWIPVADLCDSGEVAPVYNLRIAEYHTYFVGSREWGFSVWAHNACHGNSLLSKRLTTLYVLLNKTTQELLKWGISSNPTKRYTQKFLDSINARMVPLLQGSRRSMAQIERSATMQMPGWLNNESWAGALILR
jgi:RHS repeat-associated protein